VVWSYSGVRPLLDEKGVAASAVTRDYLLDFDEDGGAALLNVFGGKITTHRRLAEEALDRLAPALGNTQACWTADEHVHLPGGEFANSERSSEDSFDRFLLATKRRYSWLPDDLALRYARAYGTRVEQIIGTARKLGNLGEKFGADLYVAEVDYLVREEWARSAEDILWRRSKLGLRLKTSQRRRLQTYIESGINR
jgi:glycerol-3-phosphate dehydrogenase